MKSALLRFWICAGLFAGWIGLLLYLALTTRNPVILSRPQVLASTFDIVGTITEPASGNVTVVEVLWPEDQKGKWKTKIIAVKNLPECVRPTDDDQKEKADQDTRTENERWTAAGDYILALVSDGKGGFLVATPQRSPGFEPRSFKPHIYPATPEARRQLAEIRKQPH